MEDFPFVSPGQRRSGATANSLISIKNLSGIVGAYKGTTRNVADGGGKKHLVSDDFGGVFQITFHFANE